MVYGMQLLKFFLDNEFKIDLIVSSNAYKVAKSEILVNLENLEFEKVKPTILDYLYPEEKPENMRLTHWKNDNIAASCASGSYQSQAMIISPCSMGTIGNIAAGTSNNLIARSADVCLKERRKLILVARETPLNSIHLRNMLTLSDAGAVVLPAMPAFYQNPKTIQDQVNFITGKTLDVLGIDNESFKRWINP